MNMANDIHSLPKGYTSNPLGIIALFIVLIYGLATLVITQSNNLSEYDITLMVYFLIGFPIIVYVGFLWIVIKHHTKLYAPKDFNNDESYIAVLIAATMIQKKQSLTSDELKNVINEILNHIQHKNKQKCNQKDILWVDDNPDNNLYERYAFESLGIKITLAQSTNEAMSMIGNHNFSVIISDMGRREGKDEGFVLLQQLRESDNDTPFFFYTGLSTEQDKKEAERRGAQGHTDDPWALYEMITKTLRM